MNVNGMEKENRNVRGYGKLFCKANSGGNRAGVVLDGIVRSTAQKIHIAKVLGYSETAFILDSSVADFKLD